MKITKSQLKQIIKEELERALEQKKGMRAVIHRDDDELIPADHWTVESDKYKQGETLKEDMHAAPTDIDIDAKAESMLDNLGPAFKQLLDDPKNKASKNVVMDILRQAAEKMLISGDDQYGEEDLESDIKYASAKQIGREIGSFLPGGARSTFDE